MTSPGVLAHVDVEAALLYLKSLDGEAKSFNFRQLPGKSGGFSRKHHDIVLADVPELVRTCAQSGHNLFVVVNDGGQLDNDIRRVRAVFVDFDRDDFPDQLSCDAAMRFAEEGRVSLDDKAGLGWPRPSVVVSSGGGGYHLYWYVDDLDVERFVGVQRALAKRFGSDPSVANTSRIMRLPGSVHLKSDPRPVRLLRCDPTRRYSVNELLVGLGVEQDLIEGRRGSQARCNAAPADDPVLSWLRARDDFLKPGGRFGPGAPVDVICPNVATGKLQHSEPDSPTSTVYLPHGFRGQPRAFHCSHGHCVELKLRDFLRHIGYETPCPDFNSDDGLACRFIEWLGGRAMFARGQWYFWTGAYWRPDEGAIKAMLKSFADELSRHVVEEHGLAAARNDPAAKRLLRTAAGLLNEPRQAQVLKSAATMLRVDADSLDADPDLLAAPNGTVDLRTGMLRPADPAQYSTLLAGVGYEATASCPRWERFLIEVFPDGAEVIDYFQRYAGYCLTGHTQEEVMVVGYGSGANGKSVLAEVLRAVFGDYAVTADPSLITAANAGAGCATPEAARLAGRRLCLLNESKVGDRLDDGMVKKLVSTEKMVARALYREPFEFYPTAKLLLRTNHRPLIRDDSEGMWRRLHLLPFTAHFSAASRDPQVLATLKAELSGILAWAVRGAVLWYQHGLQPPPTIVQATKTYRSDQDVLGEWFEELTEPGDFTATATLLANFAAYAGLRSPPTVVQFTSQLKELGAAQHRRSDARGFRLALKPPSNDGDDLW